jgi:hypothetical protein
MGVSDECTRANRNNKIAAHKAIEAKKPVKRMLNLDKTLKSNTLKSGAGKIRKPNWCQDLSLTHSHV